MTRRAAWRQRPFGPLAVAGLCLGCLAASGCANLPFFGKKNDATGVGAGSAAGSAAAPEVAVYRVAVAVGGGGGVPAAELRQLLTAYLDLARFQNAPVADGITPAELDRLIIAAPAQVRSLLETEGYFNPTVEVARLPLPATTGASGAAAGGTGGSSNLPLIRVDVEPGPRTRVSTVAIAGTGALKGAADAAEPAAAALLSSLPGEWPLKAGQPFRQPAWSGAKAASLARVRAEGYPAAQWRRSSATVDAAANTAALDLLLDSGPLYRLGGLRIEGLQRYDEASVRRLSTFSAGAPYSEKLLLDYQERLQKSGLFEGASVDIDLGAATNAEPAAGDAPPAAAGSSPEPLPVAVRVRELPLQQATVGFGYSANTGARVTLEHTHRQPFGIKWIAKNKFEVGPDVKSWTGDLTSYPKPDLYRNLLGGGAEWLRSADEVRQSWNARVGRTQDKPRIERLYYAEVTHVLLETTAGKTNTDAVSGNYHWIYRDVDSLLLPTRGFTLAAQGALGYAFGSDDSTGIATDSNANGVFSRAYGRLTWYRPLGSWYTTLRGEAGQVFARDNVGVPDTLLFRAGGDDSVRGYGYRTLGPTKAGALVSGRVLLAASAEIARPIAALPSIWWALFADAGNAANRWGDISPALGVGAGIRVRSPVGPLRLDVAYGERAKALRAHLSVGVTY